MRVSIAIDPETARKLAVLAPATNNHLSLEDMAATVVSMLVDHAQQGVYRPRAWERQWLCQAFGDEWLERMTPDFKRLVDGVAVFDRLLMENPMTSTKRPAAQKVQLTVWTDAAQIETAKQIARELNMEWRDWMAAVAQHVINYRVKAEDIVR